MPTSISDSSLTTHPQNIQTFRPLHRSLPELTSDDLADLPEFDMPRAKLDGTDLAFIDESTSMHALQAGFFLLEIPKNLCLEATDRLCSEFFLPRTGSKEDIYRGFRDVKVAGEYQGYFDRPHDQWENLYIEQSNWPVFLPGEVETVGKQMAACGIAVLRYALAESRVPHELWSQVTGGLVNGKGHQMLACNHFRSEKPFRGAKFHRDSGWVTVLRSTQPGLVALINDELYALTPSPNHFIVNFGSSIEVLTQTLPIPVRANVHGVVQLRSRAGMDDRTSYALFLDSALDSDIYTIKEGAPYRLQSMREFAAQEVARTYDDASSL